MTSPASPPQPPTAFLRATLATYHLCAADVAEQTGLTARHVTQLLHGHTPITPAAAEALEEVTGVSAARWLAVESDWQDFWLNMGPSGGIQVLHAAIEKASTMGPLGEAIAEVLRQSDAAILTSTAVFELARQVLLTAGGEFMNPGHNS